jgi:hypothetical protein
VVVTWRAIATYPTAKMLRTTVATRNPAGVPMPLPNPTEIGVLPVIAVIGAALAVAMNRTARRPTDPAFRAPPLRGTGAFSMTGSSRVLTDGLPSTERGMVHVRTEDHPLTRPLPGVHGP